MSNFNINIVNKKYPNEMDIHKETTNKMLKVKKEIHKLNQNTVNKESNPIEDKTFNEKIQLMNAENLFKDSLILLNMLQKKVKSNIFEKYDIKEKKKFINNINNINNKINQNISMKKKFLNNIDHILSKIQ